MAQQAFHLLSIGAPVGLFQPGERSHVARGVLYARLRAVEPLGKDRAHRTDTEERRLGGEIARDFVARRLDLFACLIEALPLGDNLGAQSAGQVIQPGE